MNNLVPSLQRDIDRLFNRTRGAAAPRLYLGHTAPGGKKFFLDPEALAVHMLLLASSGSGKTYLLLQLFEQLSRITDIAIVVIGAIKEDLYKNCKAMAAENNLAGVSLISAKDHALPGYDICRRRGDEQVHERTGLIMESLAKAWNDKEFWTKPRLTKFLRVGVQAPVEAGLSLDAARGVLSPDATDARLAIAERVQSPELKKDLLYLNECKQSVREELVEAAGARLRIFLECPAIHELLTKPAERDLIRETIDEGKILLVDGSATGGLLPNDAQTLTTLLFNDILSYCLRRTSTTPVYLIVDEAGQIASDTLARILDLGRGQNLHLILAGQNLEQFKTTSSEPQRLYKSVLTNCRLKVLMGGLTMEELEPLVTNTFTMDLERVKLKLERTFYEPKETETTIVTETETVTEDDDEIVETETVTEREIEDTVTTTTTATDATTEREVPVTDTWTDPLTGQTSESTHMESVEDATHTETESATVTEHPNENTRSVSKSTKLGGLKRTHSISHTRQPHTEHIERKETASIQFWSRDELSYLAAKMIQNMPPQYAIIAKHGTEPELIRVCDVALPDLAPETLVAYEQEIFADPLYHGHQPTEITLPSDDEIDFSPKP